MKIWVLAGIPVALVLVALSGDSIEPTTQQASPTPIPNKVVVTESAKSVIKEVVEETVEEPKEVYIPPQPEPQPTQEVEVIIEETPAEPEETYIPPPQPQDEPEVTVEEEPVQEEPTQECHPSYSGCLKPYASDYDCAGGSGNGPYYTGKVQVIGPDVFRLDRDNDGWGCE